jgi:hypothetical protein
MAAAAVADQLDKDVWPLSKSRAKSPEPIVHLFPQTVPIFWPLDRSAQEPGDGTRPTRFPIPGSIVVPRCRGWPIFYSLRQSQEATCRTWLGQVWLRAPSSTHRLGQVWLRAPKSTHQCSAPSIDEAHN